MMPARYTVYIAFEYHSQSAMSSNPGQSLTVGRDTLTFCAIIYMSMARTPRVMPGAGIGSAPVGSPCVFVME